MMRLIVSVASSVCSVLHHEVAGLGRGERGLDRLEVAHLADEDDVGVLAQRGAQRVREASACRRRSRAGSRSSGWSRIRNSIGSSIVMMWQVRLRVDVVDHRRERGRLARAGGAGHEHRARAAPSRSTRSPSAARSCSIVFTPNGITRNTMPTVPRCWKHVDAEAAEAGDAVGEVDLARVVEALLLAPGS